MNYDHKKIEAKWQQKWVEEGVYEPNLDKKSLRQSRGEPFYNLMMFPYPSAEGLHVGNVYAFVGSDIYGRYQRMRGNEVFEPIGLDGFGIHSENYAIKAGTHPVDQSKKSEENFYKQLRAIGNGFAWNERLETYDPEYYKWTQWIFTKMFEAGLAHKKKSPVNWCPGCKTVLADEQIISSRCERCSTEVIKKDMEQWFFKITDYADRLLNDLDGLDWSEKVKNAQKNWIGRSEGALIKFPILSSSDDDNIEVFTTRPDTIFGATYMVLAPEHNLVEKLKDRAENWSEIEEYVKKAKNKTEQERREGAGEKTGVEIKGVKTTNPASKGEIPVWVADYVLSGYGTGAIMAVPAYDERDKEFAEKFNLPILDKPLIDFNEAIKISGGKRHTNYRLRDWLISRQRYWGPPIPMIHCDKCGWQPVPEKDLPVELPYIENFRPTGTNESPLAANKDFYKTKCPKCGNDAVRETDVSDTFLDSAWYYFGYLAKEGSRFEVRGSRFQKRAERWLPIDMYIGGAEHSVLHLLYTRFITKVFHDWSLIAFDEPFKKFRAHGLLIKDGAKMSKSKGNVVNPDEYIDKFGADVLRTYLMFLAPLKDGGDFRDESIMGIIRFLERVWKVFSITQSVRHETNGAEKLMHQTIKKVSEDIEALKYNTAISQLMILLSEIEKAELPVTSYQLQVFLKLLAPFAPHIAEEIWREVLSNKSSIHLEPWPEYDEKLIQEDEFDLIIQVNGKTKDTIKTKKGISKSEAEEFARNSRAGKYLRNKPKKTVFVKDRLINFVF